MFWNSNFSIIRHNNNLETISKIPKSVYKKAFSEATYERKKDSYEELKRLSSIRINTINSHRDLIEGI